ncbi:hypothetical protein VM1G_04562 [Cytospora mali]|uniref:BZIP domain-containing protein n=1 Tax=Cytospora mali TaxID=578113 RepID=A0A194VW71_CYTMA|nr:hypothetical protein VM1G_04562 [Valsa mali]
MNNKKYSSNAVTSNSNIRGDSMNNQSKLLPVTRSTAALGIISMSSASNKPNTYATNQFHDLSVEFANMEDSEDTKREIGIVANSPYVLSNMGQSILDDKGGVMEQEFCNTMDAVPKFDSEAPDHSRFTATNGMARSNPYQNFEVTPAPKFDSQAPEPANTNTGINPYQWQYLPQANTAALQETPTPLPPIQYPRGATEALQDHNDHIPPNRIAEAGPIPHPDREWRPYGTNHWHIFLASPEILKYLSTSEIKEIREHCYQLSKAVEESGSPADSGLPFPDSAYTTADAQTVWKHCDAYIRRRGQLRNNNAARRSRQRKEAELKYWKQKALEHGCPDHEFVWDEREVTPGPTANAYTSTTANAPKTRARGRQRRSPRTRGQRRAAAAAAAAAHGEPVVAAAPEAVPDFNQRDWA